MKIEKAGTGIIAGLLVVLSGCSAHPMLSAPSPALCRSVGVDVADGATVDGEIIEYHIVHPSEIRRYCAGNRRGCTWAIMDNQYAVYTIDDAVVRTHEECHAVFQEWQHTGEQE
jgi:hypothetical protein